MRTTVRVRLAVLLAGGVVATLVAGSCGSSPGSSQEIKRIYRGVIAGSTDGTTPSVGGTFEVVIFDGVAAQIEYDPVQAVVQLDDGRQVIMTGETQWTSPSEVSFTLESDAFTFHGFNGDEEILTGSIWYVAPSGLTVFVGRFAGILDHEIDAQIFRGSYSGDLEGSLGLVWKGETMVAALFGSLEANAHGTVSQGAYSLELLGVVAGRLGASEVSGELAGSLTPDESEAEGSWTVENDAGNQYAGAHVATVTHPDSCKYHVCGEKRGPEEICVTEMGGCVTDFLKNYGDPGQCIYAPRPLDMFHCSEAQKRHACLIPDGTYTLCFCPCGDGEGQGGGDSCSMTCITTWQRADTACEIASNLCWDACGSGLECTAECARVFEECMETAQGEWQACVSTCSPESCAMRYYSCMATCPQDAYDCPTNCSTSFGDCMNVSEECGVACIDARDSCEEQQCSAPDAPMSCHNSCLTAYDDCAESCFGC